MASTFRRKRNRLSLETYREARAYFLTLGCAQRRKPFAERRVVEDYIETLRACSEKHGFAVLAYCFMPDHLHLLVQGGPESALLQFVKGFKQRTAYAYHRAHSTVLWQKSYHDHVLRAEEDVRETARYVVGNPVRAALVEVAGDYPHGGSFVWGRAILEA